MLAIMHVLEELLQRFGPDHSKAPRPFARINHPTTVTTTGSAPPDQTLCPSIIARPDGEADDGVDEHHRPIGDRGLDGRASAYQQDDHEQDGEQADEPREENR